jgi:16S rRNA (cytosine967-C5)-methyltransferase
LSPARSIAFEVLRRVETGAYASDLLRAKTKSLDTRDAGLASELVFGCLRFQKQLDFLIERWAGPRHLDPEVQIAIRLGIYQLRHLDRVPAHAAVSESVELVKGAHKGSAAGLVNAVLRRAGRETAAWPDRATELSCPQWLLTRWDTYFGLETTEKIARQFLAPSVTCIASTGRQQDIGAQSIVPLLRIEPGLSFLDLCAAPGNKTAQAIQQGARAVACDLRLARLGQLAGLGCPLVVLDATQPLPFSTLFDRILLDAPCSGTGTLGRNPEIKWRLRPGDLPGFRKRQIAMLCQARERLKPGGILVYSTCSLEPEENDEVIATVPGDWQTHWRLPGIDPGDGFFAAVLTS